MHSIKKLHSNATTLAYDIMLGVLEFLLTWQHIYGWYSQHSSTATSIAAGNNNTNSVSHIVGYSDWNTCFTGENCSNTWTDSYSVVD